MLKRSGSQAARIAAAASTGTSPAELSASARAASTSSIAASQARSEVASAIAGVVRLGPKRRAEGKEDAFAASREPDVEVEDLPLGARDKGGPAVRVDEREHRVGLVGGGFVGEI